MYRVGINKCIASFLYLLYSFLLTANNLNPKDILPRSCETIIRVNGTNVAEYKRFCVGVCCWLMIFMSDNIIFDGRAVSALFASSPHGSSKGRAPLRLLLKQLHVDLHALRPHLSLLFQLRPAQIVHLAQMRQVRAGGGVSLLDYLCTG